MLTKSRKAFGWVAARAPWLVGGLLVVSISVPFLRSNPAVAEPDVTVLKTAALSDLALGERLMAIERLRALESDSARDALEDVAREGDLCIAAAACAALGRDNASGSKSRLKDVLGDSGVPDNARIAAASAVAEHWRDDDDIDDLEEKSDGKAAIEAHVAILKSRVYGKGE
jgi:hypothetical protein